MSQNRQTEVCYLETEEYYVKLFIDGVYQKQSDYFTDDLEDAMVTAEQMRMEVKPMQEDFCKEAEARAETKQKERLSLNEWPVYDQKGDLVGWLNLAEDQMPHVLCVRDKVFVQTSTKKIAYGRYEE